MEYGRFPDHRTSCREAPPPFLFRHGEEVRLENLHARAGEAAPKVRRQPAVHLDRDDGRSRLGEQVRQRPEPGADLEERGLERARQGDDLAGDVPVGEEVLPERLARGQAEGGEGPPRRFSA